MTDRRPTLQTTTARAFRALGRPLALTRAGMWAERLLRAFWPFLTLFLAVIAALMLDIQGLPVAKVWLQAGAALTVLGLLATLVLGVRHFHPPTRAEALDRLDRSLPGRPIAALGDAQAIGSQDAGSRAVWQNHVERMAERVRRVRAVAPDLDVSDRDRYGLRLLAATAILIALVFGSVWRIGGISEIARPDPAGALAGGPAWEGWAEPPTYTGRPSLYLADVPEGALMLPEGTHITLRLYGEVGSLGVRETVSRDPANAQTAEPGLEFDVARDGELVIDGPGGRRWQVSVLGDTSPLIEAEGPMEWAADGELKQAFTARDDYGIATADVRVELDLDAVDRRFGLAVEPEPREAFLLPLPLPFKGDRREVREVLVENLSEHPWARLPVKLTFLATDERGQEGASAPVRTTLPGRRFFDPLAKAVVEMRRDILWSLENGRHAAEVLRAVTYQPADVVRDAGTYLQLRTAIRELEARLDAGTFDGGARDETAAALWEIALRIEYGDLNDARERLERAQERLSEAIRNGASDEEIAALIEELQRAMQDYIRQLAQEQQNRGQTDQAENQQGQSLTGQQLQDMLDRLRELMEQGRMAEAQELLDQLRQMMENLQITQGGQGMSLSGQQAMQGLADMLHDQQDLSDDSFGALQDQFNRQGQDGQQGQSQGDGSQGQGRNADRQGQPGGSGGPGDDGPPDAGTLADRQQALRRELNRQLGDLPGIGTEEGDRARESLGRAGTAMDRAEEALRKNDLAGALDDQAEALDALRDGMRDLGDMLAQQQNGQGQQTGQSSPGGRQDPLGREVGSNGRLGTDEDLLQGEDVYRRARELLDEIRRRSGDLSRSQDELEYLRRLLDRF